MANRIHRPLYATGVLAILMCVGCSGPSARLHAAYMQTELDGQIGLGPTVAPAGFSVDPIDIQSGLGLDDSEPSLLLRAELDAGPVRITGSAFQYSGEGSGTLSGDYGGIPAMTQVDTEIDMLVGKAAVTFDLLDFDVIRISPGIGVDIFTIDSTVTDRTTLQTETIDEVIPLPMLFLQAEADVGPVGLIVDAGGIDVNYDQFSGTFFDVEAMAILEPVEHFELFAGYRWVDVDADGAVDDQDFLADFQLTGWFLGGGVTF